MESRNNDLWTFDQFAGLLIDKWYLNFAAFLLGGLMGIVVMWIWPTRYRATQDIYVAFDPYRMIHDQYVEDIAQKQFRSGDDYKNWQMSQLSVFAVHDEVLEAVIDRVQEIDEGRETLDVNTLRSSMDVGFRNTGDWHLVFLHHERDLALNVVVAWEQVLVDQVNQAIDYGVQIRLVDEQIQSLLDERVALAIRQQNLKDIQSDLLEFDASLGEMPSDSQVSPIFQSQINSRVATAAGWDKSWLAVLEDAPANNATAREMQDWLQEVLVVLTNDLELIPETIENIDDQVQDLDSEYHRLLPLTHGFAPTLTIESHQETAPVQVARVRSQGTAALVGGLIGLLLIIGFQLVRTSYR